MNEKTKKLVIVESPTKARTISKILSGDFELTASMGHIRDLPDKVLGIDIANNFKPEYVNTNKKTISQLSSMSENASSIYLATDPDREGEAIAWHIKEVLSKKFKGNFVRVEFHEITKDAIKKAFQNTREINENLVDAQQARRVLDRLVGYQISPLLWSQVAKHASAGRVQSVALRIICERERERETFVPKEYWNFTADLSWKNNKFKAKLFHINDDKFEVSDEAKATEIYNALISQKNLVVDEIKKENVRKNPHPPFITSTLQQSAGNTLRFSTKKTMMVAQSLYEGIEINGESLGLITYMRTDSFTLSEEAKRNCCEFIKSNYGKDYAPEKFNFYKNKSSAQEAHEAIRPTDVFKTPDAVKRFLEPDLYALYKLIWERFVASQMSQAIIARTTVDTAVLGSDNNKYTFRTTTNAAVFQGFMKISGNDDEDKDEIYDFIVGINKDDKCDLLNLNSEQKFTEPPARFSEPSLIKELEANGIGRPSTYSSIINTILTRRYVKKEKGRFIPEELGFKVNDYLVKTVPKLFDIGFTAEMENKLDSIEEGKVNWTEMISHFYDNMIGWLTSAKYESAPDPEKIRAAIEIGSLIKEWDTPEKLGSKTYNDKKFFGSIVKQFEKNGKITSKQWESLIQILLKYKKQIPTLSKVAKDLNFDEDLSSVDKKVKEKEAIKAELVVPDEISSEYKKVLNAIDELNLPVGNGKGFTEGGFVKSLKKQLDSGRNLSEKQINVLKRIIVAHRENVENFEETASIFNINLSEAKESTARLSLSDELLRKISSQFSYLETIKEWAKPEKKGRWTIDDKKFYSSLKKQFETKKELSEKQIAALEKLVGKYKSQPKD